MVFLQKKRESMRKGSRAIATVLCVSLLLLMAAGCGKVEEPIPVDLSSGNMGELQNGTSGEIEDDPKEAEQEDSADENVQQTEDTQPQSVGNAELDGSVRSIGSDSFVVDKAETWTEGDALYMVSDASGYEDEDKLVTVHVNQNCVWEFKTVKNGGVNPEDVSSREGSFADLKEGITINGKGSWQEDGSFLADRIVMMIFV